MVMMFPQFERLVSLFSGGSIRPKHEGFFLHASQYSSDIQRITVAFTSNILFILVSRSQKQVKKVT